MTASDIVSIALGTLGTVLAIASIVLVFAIERVRTPNVVFEPGLKYWPAQTEFAHIAVSNRPRGGWLGRCFRGTTLTSSRVSVESRRGSDSVLGPISARWSGTPEPRDSYDFPNSYRWGLAATGQPEQIAIARSEGGRVHAFSAESYRYARWQKPEWELEPGEYVVVLVLASTEAEESHAFRFVVAEDGAVSLSERV